MYSKGGAEGAGTFASRSKSSSNAALREEALREKQRLSANSVKEKTTAVTQPAAPTAKPAPATEKPAEMPVVSTPAAKPEAQLSNTDKRLQEWAALANVVNNADFKEKSHTPVTDDDWFDTKRDIFGRYANMTEEEKAIFNYHFNTGGEDAAEAYYDSIAERLNYRQAEIDYQQIEGRTLLEIEQGIRTGFDQFGSGLAGLWNSITGNEKYVPTSSTQYLGTMAREDLADNGPGIFGSSLGQLAFDVLSTTANMAPAMAVGVFNPAVGAGLMGSGAAGNAYTEMINAGYSKNQARAYAALVGGSEAGLSYLFSGIGKLGGKVTGNVVSKLVDKVDNILGKVAIKLGGEVLSEVAEEDLQAILTPWYKELTTNVEQEKPGWEEIAYNSLLTAVTTVLLQSGDTVKGVKAPVDAGKAAKTGWDGREVVTEATGSSITMDGKKYEFLGYDKNGSPVYQDAEILAEQSKQSEEKSKQADDGKPAEGEDGQNEVENSENGDIITTKGIGIQFFANKSIQKQSDRELRKSMSSWKSRLAEHTAWLSNPKLHDQYWDEKTPRHKAGLLKHWQHEIENFKNNLKEAEDELKKRGNYDD